MCGCMVTYLLLYHHRQKMTEIISSSWGSTSPSPSVIIITDRPLYTVVDCRRLSLPVAADRICNELPRLHSLHRSCEFSAVVSRLIFPDSPLCFTSPKLEQILERIYTFHLRELCGKRILKQRPYCSVELFYGESLKEEGALAVVICAVCVCVYVCVWWA